MMDNVQNCDNYIMYHRHKPLDLKSFESLKASPQRWK
jgi:hypothetical protein